MGLATAFVPVALRPVRRRLPLRTALPFPPSTSPSASRHASPPSMRLAPQFSTFRRALLAATTTSAPDSSSSSSFPSSPRSPQSLTTSPTPLQFCSVPFRRPLRVAAAPLLRLCARLARLRARHPRAYLLSRQAMSLSLACIAYIITRSALTTPPSTIPLSTTTTLAASSTTFPRLPLPALPPKLSEVLRPFTESFGVVFLSEFGDKSMFATALMAMKHSPLIVCVGALAALTVMTFIACFLGQLMHYLPPTITHYSSIALFVFFGLQMLIQARSLPDTPGGSGGERADAEEMVAESAISQIREATPLSVLVKVSSLIFVAEWCDRSMLATMALAASNNTVAVIGGATLANIVCTAMAVFAATLVASRISERVVALVAGVLFEVFAVFTYLEGPQG